MCIRDRVKLAHERGPCPDAAESGVMARFSHKMAIAPTASISIICGGTSAGIEPVSYTHLDVYKRQGTPYPIDREMTAYELGFNGPNSNSMDGVGSRDFALEALSLIHI